MNLSKGFSIRWDQGDIRYFPEEGVIQNAATGRRFGFSVRRSGAWDAVFSPRPPRDFFRPVCLTLFLGGKCNLNCAYCYAPGKTALQESVLDLRMVERSAEWVSSHSVARKMPFVLGFHGGNEPLLYRKEMEACISVCRQIAEKKGVPLRVHCTTNGVVPAETARWAAANFSGITVSWDGPARFHDLARPLLNGKPTEEKVKNTVEILQNESGEGFFLKVRTTVTRHTVEHLEDIAGYFATFGIRHVEMMPVFPAPTGQNQLSLAPGKAAFVYHFLKARHLSRQHGMTLHYPGSRMEDTHDRFCTFLQDNLSLGQDGSVLGCFLVQNGREEAGKPFIFGQAKVEDDQIQVDWQGLENLAQAVKDQEGWCEGCFNRLHCAKGCPERCPVTPALGLDPPDCLVEKRIGIANIVEASGFQLGSMPPEEVERFFREVEIRELAPVDI